VPISTIEGREGVPPPSAGIGLREGNFELKVRGSYVLIDDLRPKFHLFSLEIHRRGERGDDDGRERVLDLHGSQYTMKKKPCMQACREERKSLPLTTLFLRLLIWLMPNLGLMRITVSILES